MLLQPVFQHNPAGRPKGKRINEVARSIFLADIIANGAEALKSLREKNVEMYFTFVMRFCPPELIRKLEDGYLLDYSEMSYDEFDTYYNKMRHGKNIEKIISADVLP